MENLDLPSSPQIKDGKMGRFCPSRGFILDLGGWGWGFAVPFYFVQDYSSRCVMTQKTWLCRTLLKWFLACISFSSLLGSQTLEKDIDSFGSSWDSKRWLKIQDKWLQDRSAITCQLYDFRRHLACVQPPPPLRKNRGGGAFADFFVREVGGCTQARRALCTADLKNRGECSL